MQEKRHIIVVLLENEFGALSRVSNLFSARGYNIESLNVATTPDPTLSRMTITSVGSAAILEQIIKQLNKLIDVVDAHACLDSEHLSTEYALLRLRKTPQATAVIAGVQESNQTHINVVEENDQQIMVGISTDTNSLEQLLSKFDQDDIVEISRSGALAVRRCQSEPATGD